MKQIGVSNSVGKPDPHLRRILKGTAIQHATQCAKTANKRKIAKKQCKSSPTPNPKFTNAARPLFLYAKFHSTLSNVKCTRQ